MTFKETALAKLAIRRYGLDSSQEFYWFDAAVELIESIQEDNQWIPVEDRLPKEWEKVIVTYDWVVESREFISWKWYDNWYDPYYQEWITHWMPLPLPPK